MNCTKTRACRRTESKTSCLLLTITPGDPPLLTPRVEVRWKHAAITVICTCRTVPISMAIALLRTHKALGVNWCQTLLEETMLSMNTCAEVDTHRRVNLDFFELPLWRCPQGRRALLWTMDITCPKNQTKALVRVSSKVFKFPASS